MTLGTQPYTLTGFITKNWKLHQLLAVSVLIFFTACDNNTTECLDCLEDNVISIAVPRSLTRTLTNLSQPIIGNVDLLIQPLGIEVVMRLESSVAQATVPDIPPGTYTIKITFRSKAFVVLAEVSQTFEVSKENNVVRFYQYNYRYPDGDQDGFTNLEEVRLGGFPNDPARFPASAQAFVTSTSDTGDLSSWPDAGGEVGLAAGDEICQKSADRAGLNGEFKAWLSDSNTDAYCHVQGLTGRKFDNCGQEEQPSLTGHWVQTNPEKTPFAPDIAHLTADNLKLSAVLTPLEFDEFGQRLTDNPNLRWTGTHSTGIGLLEVCENWSSAADEILGITGVSATTVELWTKLVSSPCSEKNHLMCFEQNPQAALPDFKTDGHRAFITSEFGSGDFSQWISAEGKSGLEAADAICTNSAKRVGMTNANQFKAWISDDTINASERFQSDGPWVRLDGLLIAKNKADLTAGILNTSISMNEQGENSFLLSWSGKDNGRSPPSGLNCNNWSNAEQTVTGVAGLPQNTSSNWSDLGAEATCQTTQHLYCFED